MKQVALLIRQLLGANSGEAVRSTAVHRCLHSVGNGLQGLFPGHFFIAPAHIHERGFNALVVMNDTVSQTPFGAEVTFIDADIVIFVCFNADDLPFFTFQFDGTSPRTVITGRVGFGKQGGQTPCARGHVHQGACWANGNALSTEFAIERFVIGGANLYAHSAFMKVEGLNSLDFIAGANTQPAHDAPVQIKFDNWIGFDAGLVTSLDLKPPIEHLQHIRVVLQGANP